MQINKNFMAFSMARTEAKCGNEKTDGGCMRASLVFGV